MTEAESPTEQKDDAGSQLAEDADTGRTGIEIAGHSLEPLDAQISRISREVSQRRRTWYGNLAVNYQSDDADGLATFIAFNAMFAFMPVILTLAIIVATFLGIFASAEEVANNEIVLDLPDPISEPVRQIMLQSSENLLGIGLVSLIMLFWGGSRLYSSLDRAFSRIYMTPRRPWVTRRLVGIILVPAIALIIILTSLVIPLFVILLLIPLGQLIDFAPSLVGLLMLIAIIYLIAFTMMIFAYTFVPAHAPRVRSALPGAAIAAFLFLLLMFIFPIYTRFFGGYSTYGAVFGLILTMMFWFYLAAQIIIIGAEINAYREGRRREFPDM